MSTFDRFREGVQKPHDDLDDNFIADLFATSSHITYPQDLARHHSTIALMPFTEQTMGNKKALVPKIKKIPLPNIFLPLPDSLVANSAQDLTAENLAISIRDERRMGSAASTIGKAAIGGIINKISSSVGKTVGDLNIAGTISSATRTGFTSSVELLWNGPKLRTWPMSFRFQPHNNEEEKAITKLLMYLMWLHAGRYGSLITRWPQVFDIQILGKDGEVSDLNAAYTFTAATLSDISWDPAPDGKFLLGRGAVPQDSVLNLVFTEVRGLDKSTVEKEYRSPKVLTRLTRKVKSPTTGRTTLLSVLGRG